MPIPTDQLIVNTKQQIQKAEADHEPRLVYWISLDEAERRFAVERSELIARVRRGQLDARRILCKQDLVVAVSSRELKREFAPRPLGAQLRPTRAQGTEDLESIRVKLQDERVARARLEGELRSSTKIERSMQRYADRLEGELAEARKQAMTLARALGRAERLAAGSGNQLSAAPGRSRWKFWR